MSNVSKPFTIRALATGGTTLDDLRKALLEAPAKANLVLLRLQDETLRFPLICPNCEQPAAFMLRVQRAFLFHIQSDDDTPNGRVPSIDEINVPFCAACLQRQHREQSAPSPWTPARRILSESEGFAGLVVLGVALLFLSSALKYLAVAPLVMAIVPVAIGSWLLGSTWKKSRYMSVLSPTNVDLAFDFTPSMALPYEPAWRAFQFRSQLYADLFREANFSLAWDPRSFEAKSAAANRQQDSSRTNLIVGTVVAAVLIWWFLHAEHR